MQADFERDLSNKIITRRLITGCLALVFLALFILFFCLREASRMVVVHGSGFSLVSWTEVTYEDSYISLIVISLIDTALATITLILNLLLCGHKTIRKDQHCITIFRGMTSSIVYVDGQEKGRMGPFSHSNVVEVWLSNGVRVTISFSRAIWYMAHVSFSDDTASREV